jgi:4-amino-4-deoxy-L-arabinose transferase-like glycosyltransferase
MKAIQRSFSDIRFWIILFFIVRLYGITFPPLEVVHNWRQTTVTMVSRNFLETDPGIFYPRIDIAGEKSGITGMEFPVFNYLIYLVSVCFGYTHWYGRLINLIVSSFGIYYFFKLVEKYFNRDIAFYAGMVMIFSLWFSYSRKIMPDTFAISLILAGIYFGSNYLDRKHSHWNLLAYFFLVSLGILSKLPAGYLLVVFLPLFLNNEIRLRSKIILSTLTLISAVIVYAYYFRWVPYLIEKYQFWHFFMGKSISEGFQDIMMNVPKTLVNFYEEPIKYSGFLMFLFGIYKGLMNKEKHLLYVFLILFIAFIFIILKSGNVFYNHAYYILPFVPVMALVAGYGISMVKRRNIVIIIMVLIGFEGIINQKQDFVIHGENKAILNLEKDLDHFSQRSDLILINSENCPTPMYFAHRKGWITFNDSISYDGYLEKLGAKGLKYIVILKRAFGSEITLEYPLIFDNQDYSVYELRN